MSRLGTALLIAALAASPAAAQTAPAEEPPPLDRHELLRKYVWSTLGPAGVIHASVTSGLEVWRDAPSAWPTNGKGFAERWASEYAATAIGGTTKYAVARLFHQDPTFVRCACTGVGPRLLHALSGPFKARDAQGEWVVSAATVAGLMAQNVIPAATWYPAPRGVHDGAAHAMSGVAAKMLVDVGREFVPQRWLKRPF